MIMIIIIIVITIIIIIIIIISIRESYYDTERSACWDLHESSERCSVYEQND